MAITYVDYTASAGQTDFNFSFPYLEDEHVKVEINGLNTTDFTIVTTPSQKVVLNSGALANAQVRVRRRSAPNQNLVDFVNGSVLTESELDLAYRHNRYLSEEIAELNDASLQVEAGGTQWDAKGLRIKNVGTATATTDAVTKVYVDNKVAQVSSGATQPPLKWQFTGLAGANGTYTVTGAEVNGDTAYDVSIDGLVKEPGVDFTVNPNTDTLTIVPNLTGGEDIVVIQRGFGVAVAGTVSTNSLVDGSVTNPKLAAGSVTSDKISTTDTKFNVQSDGKVGIGTSNPAHALDVVGDVNITGNYKVNGSNLQTVPTGTVSAFAGSSAPTGYLLCDGTAVNRTTYAALFGVISTTYGVGDGSTTFNLPDLRGRVVAGLDNMGGTSANRLTDPASTVNSIDGDILGNTGGHETHLNTAAQSGLPDHTHDIALDGGIQTAGGTAYLRRNGITDNANTPSSTGVDASSAHNNVQPTIILNYIIKI